MMVNNLSNYKIKLDSFSENTELTSTISAISYEVENGQINGLDNNEISRQLKDLQSKGKFPKNLKFVDSNFDKRTGLSTNVFIDKNTNKAIIGVAGTNPDSDLSRDLKADFDLATKAQSVNDSYFKDTQTFINEMQKKYDIDTITGHSLGGRNAVLLGMAHNINNVVIYNSAPISFMSVTEMKSMLVPHGMLFPFTSDAKNYNDIIKSRKNYKGNITRFSTNFDYITIGSRVFGGLFFGKNVTVFNNKSHSISNFLTPDAQGTIKKTLYNVDDVLSNNAKNYEKIKKATSQKIKSIAQLRAKMINQGGGILSSSQQKYLEYATALSITVGLKNALDTEVISLKSMYNSMCEKFSDTWKVGLEGASNFGTALSHEEILSALDEGNVNEHKIVEEPHEKINKKLKKLNRVSKDYEKFIEKMKNSMKQIVKNDQTLASQLGVE